MENIKVIKLDDKKDLNVNEIHQTLVAINNKIDEAVDSNKDHIERSDDTISNLLQLMDKKDEVIKYLETKNEELNRKVHGDKQLINKLLGDIERLNNDIVWYKKTYEKRSLLGTIKEKLFNKKP